MINQSGPYIARNSNQKTVNLCSPCLCQDASLRAGNSKWNIKSLQPTAYKSQMSAEAFQSILLALCATVSSMCSKKCGYCTLGMKAAGKLHCATTGSSAPTPQVHFLFDCELWSLHIWEAFIVANFLSPHLLSHDPRWSHDSHFKMYPGKWSLLFDLESSWFGRVQSSVPSVSSSWMRLHRASMVTLMFCATANQRWGLWLCIHLFLSAVILHFSFPLMYS